MCPDWGIWFWFVLFLVLNQKCWITPKLHQEMSITFPIVLRMFYPLSEAEYTRTGGFFEGKKSLSRWAPFQKWSSYMQHAWKCISHGHSCTEDMWSRLETLVGCLATDNSINEAGKRDRSSQNLLHTLFILPIHLSVMPQTLILSIVKGLCSFEWMCWVIDSTENCPFNDKMQEMRRGKWS